MGQVDGFIRYRRKLPGLETPDQRVNHFKEFVKPVSGSVTTTQAARCMDCGVPFCMSGCPLGNVIPEFNHAVSQSKWREAFDILISTNNFPEFTGRICPAPCESACVLGIGNDPVAIEHIEKQVIERAFRRDWVQPRIPTSRTGKLVAVIGSGPAGLAVADQLNQVGHQVTIYERDNEPGGLLRYGIPDFKLSKDVVERRIQLMQEEGIIFKTGHYLGRDISSADILSACDAMVLCGGSTVPRDLNIDGRSLPQVYFAMEFLTESNRLVSGEVRSGSIDVEGKHVVVIGGGDTGSDCVGTANRRMAASVTQIELAPKPPEDRHESTPWPMYPLRLKTSTSHEEGCTREWSLSTLRFVSDENGKMNHIEVAEVIWQQSKINIMPSSKRTIPCDIVFIAIGFSHPEHDSVLNQLGIKIDPAGNVETSGYKTSLEKVFCAGDMKNGQSLVVSAIADGRLAATEVHEYLMQQ